jgi:hypothetical protein
MSSPSRLSVSSRPPDGNATDAIGHGSSASHFPHRAHARPVNIPERRLWSHDRPKFYIRDSSGSSQGGSSTKSSSTASEGRDGPRGQTVSPYGSFFVKDMDLDGPADSNSPSQGGGGWTRGTTTDLNGVFSARRPPASQNGLHRRQPPMVFDTTDPTYFRMAGVLPAPGHNALKEGEGIPSSVTANTHQSQSNYFTPWNRENRSRSNSPHKQARNSQARQLRVMTTLPPGSSLSNPGRQTSREETRTTWQK